MKKIEIISAIIIFVGLVLKYFHIPGASLLLILSIMTLSVIYCYASFAFFNGVTIKSVIKDRNEKLKPFSTISAFFLGWGLSVLIIGILFYLQIWSGFHLMLLIGLIATFVGAIAFLIARKDKILPTILRTFLIGGFGLFLYLYPIDNYIDFVQQDIEYATLLKKVQSHPDNATYRQELYNYQKEKIEKKK